MLVETELVDFMSSSRTWVFGKVAALALTGIWVGLAKAIDER